LNPVRAKMVTEPAEYRWLSYQINGFGKKSDLCISYHEYLPLGKDTADRRHTYRGFLSHHRDGPKN